MSVSKARRVAENTARPSSKAAPARSQRPRTQQTRRRLLDAGRTLFAQHGGPETVTTHTIAAEAGYASGTFYLHFKDKHSLFRELAEEAANDLEERILAAAVGCESASEIIHAEAEALVGFAEEKRDLIRLIFHPSLPGRSGDQHQKGQAVDCTIGAGILEQLAHGVSSRRREAIAEGRVKDCFNADVLAQALVGMWAHVLAWWSEDPSRAKREDLIRTLTHFQLHGDRSGEGLCSLPSSRRHPV